MPLCAAAPPPYLQACCGSLWYFQYFGTRPDVRIVKKNLSAGRPTAPEAAPVAPRLGRLCTIAAAVATLAFPMADAWALSLGRIAVQSALGQPLRAEIDIPAITPDEAGSLTAVVAPLSAFKSAGMDYNAVLSGVRIQLQPRGDGRAVLQLTSDRVINDPFVDLIIEANWASGRIVRDYTLLFDPPEMARNAPQAITVAPPPPRQPDYTPAPAAAAPAPVTPIFYPPPPSAFRPSPANSGPSRLPHRAGRSPTGHRRAGRQHPVASPTAHREAETAKAHRG